MILLNWLRPKQNGRYFVDYMLKYNILKLWYLDLAWKYFISGIKYKLIDYFRVPRIFYNMTSYIMIYQIACRSSI